MKNASQFLLAAGLLFSLSGFAQNATHLHYQVSEIRNGEIRGTAEIDFYFSDHTAQLHMTESESGTSLMSLQYDSQSGQITEVSNIFGNSVEEYTIDEVRAKNEERKQSELIRSSEMEGMNSVEPKSLEITFEPTEEKASWQEIEGIQYRALIDGPFNSATEVLVTAVPFNQVGVSADVERWFFEVHNLLNELIRKGQETSILFALPRPDGDVYGEMPVSFTILSPSIADQEIVGKFELILVETLDNMPEFEIPEETNHWIEEDLEPIEIEGEDSH